METIKLIIWDMDETFWKGTLSDGEVEPIQENIDIVKRLTDRGIVNSVCSKNDFDKTKDKLVEMGVWDYFVFPSIDWTNKGIRVKNIISDMGLRPVNVLFLDDNINNLKEAQYECSTLQVATPDKLADLLKDPAFDGKDDSDHSRLKQYKILEKKAEARQQSSSNEEFLYQSDIHVELIEDCSDKLQRIHEMIHRNNQLNFTKDRISREEVDELFTDSTVRKGVVHVTDKYGDHGIIGCYAIKDNVAKQFVFSCRILGMGVEQWVYAELGYPEITVVGEVANQLNKTDKPAWINQAGLANSAICTTGGGGTDTPRLIVYGTCPLRPVWGYLQPKLPNAKFAEIDPAPPIGNLAVAFRESREYLDDLCKKVNVFDAVNTFDRDIVEGKADYLLITMISSNIAWKYVNKNDGTYFYSRQILTEVSADKSIIQNYECNPITFEDIKTELCYLCEHLPANMILFIQTAPDVIFSQGKNNEYYNRLEVNKIAEYLSEQYANVRLIDIRKYAKTPADFFEPASEHYNRAIGYKLASDVLNVMGIDSTKANIVNKNYVPSNAINGKNLSIGKTGDVLNYVAYIRNGYYFIKLDLTNAKSYNIVVEFWHGRHIEAAVTLMGSLEYKLAVDKPGLWFVKIKVSKNNDKYYFQCKSIDYTVYSYYQYVDSHAEDYDGFINSIDQFCKDSKNTDISIRILQRYIANLSAANVNFTDYFVNNNINDITIFTNRRIGETILPYFYNSKVNIKNIISVDWDWYYWADAGNWGCRVISYDDFINNKSLYNLTNNDTIFYAVRWVDYLYFITELNRFPGKKVHIEQVLNSLYTEKFFVEKFSKVNSPKIITVRCPNMMAHHAFPYSSIKSNERVTFTYLKDDLTALSKLDNFDKFPAQYSNLSIDELKETLVRPIFYRDNYGLQKMRDRSGKYFNIKNGFRVTSGQLDNYEGRIFLVGGSIVYGCGNKDSDTLASILQKCIGSNYRVENCGNFYKSSDNDMGYADAINMISSINATKKDIVILFLHHWVENDYLYMGKSYPLWDAITEPIIKLDAFPVFEKQDRPDYFLLPEAYTAEGNQAIAELIADKLKEIGYLK